MKLKKRYEERISGREIDPIVLKSLEECVEWLVPCDARDDVVLGTDGLTFGVLEDAEDGIDDPPTTRQSQRGSSSRVAPILQDSSEDDDFDDDRNYDVDDDGDDDGIGSGSDEDI